MDSKQVALGQALWNELAPTFLSLRDENGITSLQERARYWAGFMAACVGSMAGDLGFEITNVVIDGVMKAADDVAKQNTH